MNKEPENLIERVHYFKLKGYDKTFFKRSNFTNPTVEEIKELEKYYAVHYTNDTCEVIFNNKNI